MALSKDVIEKGIEMELEGKKFYTDAAEKTSKEFEQNMFAFLARQENIHVLILKRIEDELDRSQQWPEMSALDWAKVDSENFFEEERPLLERITDITGDEVELLKFAMDIEEKNRQFYLELSDRTTDVKEKNILNRLAAEESKHYNYVESYYRYFEDKGLRMNE